MLAKKIKEDRKSFFAYDRSKSKCNIGVVDLSNSQGQLVIDAKDKAELLNNFISSVFTRESHTHTHTQPFYGSVDFVRDNLCEPVPEETFTHSHLSWSSIVPYLLHPSTTIHGILPVQSTSLTVSFHNLSPSFLWTTGYPLASYISSPNHCLLFAAHAHTIATSFTVVPRLCHLILVSLSTLYLEFYLVVSCHTSI